MEVFDVVAAVRNGLAALPRPVGFVPTMGALHEGHLELVRAARGECASVVASVFVNPAQFGPGEDFERYPRDIEGDRAKLAAAGVDLLFAPGVDEIYPPGFSTTVDVGDVGAAYEGAARPTHFRGVATVVTKLLHIMQPDTLYLGQKDAQQTAVLRKLIRDLSFPVHTAIVPTVREQDGLAMSSRNVYLSQEQRAAAPSLHAALETMLEELRRGSDAASAREHARVRVNSIAQLEYLDLVDADTFKPLVTLQPPAFIIGAARFGSTRLIDNLMVAQ